MDDTLYGPGSSNYGRAEADDVIGVRVSAAVKPLIEQLDGLRAQLASLQSERDMLHAQLTRMQAESNAALEKHRRVERECQHAQRACHFKNLMLDALYWVWCDGGCEKGMARFGLGHRGPLTEEVIQLAESNTRRMRRWFVNAESRRRNAEKGQ